MKSIRAKIALGVIVLFVVALGMLAGLNYWQAEKMLIQDVETEIGITTQSNSQEISAFLDGVKMELSAVARTPIMTSGNHEAIMAYLAAETAKNKIYETVTYTDDKGNFVDHMGKSGNLGNKEYFKRAMKGETVIADPATSMATGKTIIMVTTPIFAGDRVIGMLFGSVNIESIEKQILNIKMGQTGYAYLIRGDGLVIVHPVKDVAGKINSYTDARTDPTLKGAIGKMMNGERGITKYKHEGVDKYQAYAPIKGTGWSLAVNIPVSEATAKLSAFTWTSLITIVIVLIVAVLAIMWGTVRITKPLQTLKEAVNRIAGGDLSITQVAVDSQDELGHLARAFETMAGNLRNLVNQISTSSGQVAASSEELTASSEQSAQAANQIATAITDVAAGANEQLDAASDTTAVVEQMTASIQQIAANANQVAANSAQAAEKAKNGDKVVEKAVVQMNQIEATVTTSAQVVTKLGERSKEIGQIVDTISGIAGQTNLLALNAAIEAARAGEQGRGFAVVAEEVRKLAEQSQEAAKKIADLIGEIQVDTGKAVVAMDNGTREVKTGAEVVNTAGTAFREIAGLVSEVSGQVKEISAAMQQMAAGSQQIVGSVKKIDSLGKKSAGEAQGVSAAAEEQLASMEEIASSSQELAKLAQDLQNAVTGFRL